LLPSTIYLWFVELISNANQNFVEKHLEVQKRKKAKILISDQNINSNHTRNGTKKIKKKAATKKEEHYAVRHSIQLPIL
jgi:hypothetical protein